MENKTDFILDADFKDAQPLKTVEKIKDILSTYGIEVVEHWFDSQVPYCYSNRINVVGTNFRVYGKGLTREFAHASGYGELIERLQLGYITSHKAQKEGHYYIGDPRETSVSYHQLLEQNGKWYESLSAQLARYTGITMTPEQILSQFADPEGNLVATPYFNVTRDRTDYLPAEIRNWLYTSNGCAAGNTMEEALVQGLSEIVERHNQMQILSEGTCPPTIPEEVLQKCKVAYSIITYVRNQGFQVILKDCSLGQKFPVVCACIIDRKTGKYHTHFGAYPNFEIALERSLTESFQGYDLENIAIVEDFSYDLDVSNSQNILVKELTKGTAEKFTGFFVGQCNYSYNADQGFTGENSATLWKQCVEYFSGMGYDLLVRDSSTLGFPTYQILIPGYAENFIFRLARQLHDHRYLPYAVKTLRDPSKASLQDMMGLLKHLNSISEYGSNISRFHGFLACSKLSAKLDKQQEACMMAAALAYVYYTLGKYEETIRQINVLIGCANQEDQEYLICLKRYLNMLNKKYDKAEMDKVLRFFHQEQTVEALYRCVAQGGNPLERFTLHCDMTCPETCLLRNVCQQKRVNELDKLIFSRKQALSYDDFVAQLRASIR